MKYRPLIACLPFVAGVIFMACNGESGPPLEEYFQQIEPLFVDTADRSTAWEQQLQDKLAVAQSQEERVVVFQEGLDGMASAFSALSVQLRPIEPAEKAKDAQAEVQTTTQALLDLFQNLWDRGQAIETEDDLDRLLAELDGPEITAAEKQQAEACSNLQAVAEENDLDVDLACPTD